MKNGSLDHKTKMISVRLSEAELEFLKTRHQHFGARNVSDLARLAVQRMMQDSDYPVNNIAATIATMSETIANLEGRIRTLEAQLAGRWGEAVTS